MTPIQRIHALAPGMAAREAFRTLLESGEEQLPVIEDDALLGHVATARSHQVHPDAAEAAGQYGAEVNRCPT